MESGSARLGMMVAETLRRKRKITRMTRKSVNRSVNFTSRTDSRIDWARSRWISRLTDAGSSLRNCGRRLRIESATSTVFVPGCFWMARMRPRLSLNHVEANLPSRSPSVMRRSSSTKAGSPRSSNSWA